ncbi:porin, partial [Candidatus Latescibacterota bacterium]
YNASRPFSVLALVMVSLLLCSFKILAQNKPNFSGYVKTQFSHNTKISKISIINARVKLSGTIDEKTGYGIQIDTVRDDILLDAFITRTITDGLTIMAGQFRTPYSTDNLTNNAKTTFINRPYSFKETSPHFRDQGIQCFYKHKYFDAIGAIMNGSGQNTAEFNNNKGLALRLVAKLIPQFNLSGNFYTAKMSDADDESDDFINVGAHGSMSGFSYVGEYAQQKHGSLTNHALIAWLSYDWKLGSDLINIITPAVRAEMADPNVDTDDDAKSRYSFAVTAHFNEKFANRIMLNYELTEVETGEADDLLCVEYIVLF